MVDILLGIFIRLLLFFLDWEKWVKMGKRMGIKKLDDLKPGSFKTRLSHVDIESIIW